VADGGGLENRYGAQVSSWVRIPHPPPNVLRCGLTSGNTPAPKTGTPGSAAVVEGHLIAVGVRERESAAERPVDGR
jgi:hypothetical protein